ncbi:hypothetical protein [Mycoplasmopsis cynos]|uniref:hypothetical protein n=1 Tax=Mycoplasmopsis cynos TaxID=171284 RepID=UPI0024C7B65B|nr:hypothetical protein [Mycoplasmopsis cynos]WAM05013.1 hypothetical protein ONA01_02450 [Mycoplasmopsis cynos]
MIIPKMVQYLIKLQATTVHMGADEFYVDHDAYYDFVNEMFKYFIDKGIQVRLWGSFSHLDQKLDL